MWLGLDKVCVRTLGGAGQLEQRKDHCEIYVCINDRHGHTLLFGTLSMFIFVGLLWGTGPAFRHPCRVPSIMWVLPVAPP
jgi:hypothetical protein